MEYRISYTVTTTIQVAYSKGRAKAGALVLIKDENLPPLRWPLARVIDLIPGTDGVARVARLQTGSGVTKRAIAKLCLLPLDDHLESTNFQRAEDVGNR